MSFKQIILSLTLLCTALSLRAQQPAANWCGTSADITPWLAWYRDHRHEFVQMRSDDMIYVPVTIHIVGTDEGLNHFSLEKAVQAVCGMNEHFAPANIGFYLFPGDPVRYINNTEWFEHEYSGGAQMIQANNIPDRLNAYIVSDPAGACGYSWMNAIVLKSACSGTDNTTWSHEAGHHFSLPHTFSGWENTEWNFTQPAPATVGNNRKVEKTDGSNCDIAGDFFCDTPPDYLNDRWQCDDNQESNQLQIDPDSVSFRSDASFLMSYASDYCQSRFSLEQIDAMRANLETQHASYIQVTDLEAGVDDNLQVQLVSPIDSHIVQYNNFELVWNPVPHATIYAVEICLYPSFGEQVRLFYKTVYNETSVTVAQNILNNRTLYWRVRAYNEWDVCNPNDNLQVGILKTRNISATNELERVVTAELSPNPVVAGMPALLNVTSDETMNAKLHITDASGRICVQQELRIYPGENKLDIETNQLQAGVYIISVQNDKGLLLKRLVVSE